MNVNNPISKQWKELQLTEVTQEVYVEKHEGKEGRSYTSIA